MPVVLAAVLLPGGCASLSSPCALGTVPVPVSVPGTHGVNGSWCELDWAVNRDQTRAKELLWNRTVPFVIRNSISVHDIDKWQPRYLDPDTKVTVWRSDDQGMIAYANPHLLWIWLGLITSVCTLDGAGNPSPTYTLTLTPILGSVSSPLTSLLSSIA